MIPGISKNVAKIIKLEFKNLVNLKNEIENGRNISKLEIKNRNLGNKQEIILKNCLTNKNKDKLIIYE